MMPVHSRDAMFPSSNVPGTLSTDSSLDVYTFGSFETNRWHPFELRSAFNSVDSAAQTQSVENSTIHSTLLATNTVVNSNAPIAWTPLGLLDAGIQTINSQQPAFQPERSDDGTLAYRCKCGMTIKRMGDLRRHWRSRKHGGRRFACLGCTKSYSRKYMLNQHVRQTGHATTIDAMELDSSYSNGEYQPFLSFDF